MKVAVIGAGIVGLSTANWLKRYGQDVTLFDREDPGSQASFGNAGTYAKYANIPTNSSSFFYLFPYLLLNKNSPLFFKRGKFIQSLPWLMQYLSNCRQSKVTDTSNKLTTLLSLVDEGYEDLFNDADIENLISRESIFYVWSNKLFYNSARKDFETREKTGVKIEIISKNEINDVEPNINNIFYKGALFKGSYFAKNPKKISEKLLQLFIEKGGNFKKEKIDEIKILDTNKVNIHTNENTYTYDRIVLCAGVWSKKLTDKLGENIPLASERGYHLMYPHPENSISRPIAWQERGVYFTPMQDGLRAGGVVELGGNSSEISSKVVSYLKRATEAVFPNINNHLSEWVGFRPSVPDSLPVIGQSKKNPYIYYCFGHQHIGWSLGGISGKLIAQEICANKTDIDLKPFSVGRF